MITIALQVTPSKHTHTAVVIVRVGQCQPGSDNLFFRRKTPVSPVLVPANVTTGFRGFCKQRCCPAEDIGPDN